jgi:hypothetical protein
MTVEFAYFGLAAAVGGTAFLLAGFWYVLPRLSRLPLPQALTPLLLLGAFRVNGLFFLVPGVASPAIPRGFAVPTGYGDAIAALLALASAITLRVRPSFGIALAWTYNILGLLDLANAFVQTALLGVQPSHLGATWFLPAINVPSILVAHVLMFILLVRATVRSGEPLTPYQSAQKV